MSFCKQSIHSNIYKLSNIPDDFIEEKDLSRIGTESTMSTE